MTMILTDTHTHSMHSSDGREPLAAIAPFAKALGLRYYGVSEHFDYEYLAEKIVIYGKEVTSTTDAARYFSEARALQNGLNDATFTMLAGCEFGFSPAAVCAEAYRHVQEEYAPDFIINSVHTVHGKDAWFPEFFAGKTKEQAYRLYLETVLESLSAPYSYDVVGHLGYVSRNAPYADRKLRYEDFPALCDEILRTVIAKDKILEVNAASRGAGSDFLPDTDILSRYYELGGRAVSYGSDTHDTRRLLYRRSLVTAALRRIGFTHISVPCRGERILAEL